MINYAGGTAVPIPLEERFDFSLDVDQTGGAGHPRTPNCIIVNSPNNPCGSVISGRGSWSGSRGSQADNDVAVHRRTRSTRTCITKGSHTSVTKFDDMAGRTIILDGFSKSYAMTGWRSGIRRVSGVHARRRDQADDQQRVMHLRSGSDGRDRGVAGPPRLGGRDDGGIPRSGETL